jgi:hypothetical protein
MSGLPLKSPWTGPAILPHPDADQPPPAPGIPPAPEPGVPPSEPSPPNPGEPIPRIAEETNTKRPKKHMHERAYQYKETYDAGQRSND